MISFSISNWGPTRCWIGEPEGHCGEKPRPGKRTCGTPRHAAQERRAARFEAKGYDYLHPKAAEIASIEASMQAAHGVIS